jgi:hypothetical protein
MTIYRLNIKLHLHSTWKLGRHFLMSRACVWPSNFKQRNGSMSAKQLVCLLLVVSGFIIIYVYAYSCGLCAADRCSCHQRSPCTLSTSSCSEYICPNGMAKVSSCTAFPCPVLNNWLVIHRVKLRRTDQCDLPSKPVIRIHHKTKQQ